jgi:hypothetical protein
MKRYLDSTILVTILGVFLLSCNAANVIQTPLVLENQSTPTAFSFTTFTPLNTSTATARPTTQAYATFESANSTAEALGNICIGTKFITTIETSPNGKWIAATCDQENGADESPLQVSSIDHSRNWKIYYSDYIFSPSMDKRGLILDGDDEVIPYYWSKDGRFLFARVRSRLSGCCWIGGRYVLLVRLNLETGAQVALLNTDYYSPNPFDFIISDDDRYLLFSAPSNQPYDFALLDFQTWETQQVLLKFEGDIDVVHARISPDASKVILPLFKQLELNDFYVNSITLIDLITGDQNILISDITPENELFPIRWLDNSHVLLSNINPVYDVSDKKERHWLLDIYSGQLEETP